MKHFDEKKSRKESFSSEYMKEGKRKEINKSNN
jgi:hypothetical protein